MLHKSNAGILMIKRSFKFLTNKFLDTFVLCICPTLNNTSTTVYRPGALIICRNIDKYKEELPNYDGRSGFKVASYRKYLDTTNTLQ